MRIRIYPKPYTPAAARKPRTPAAARKSRTPAAARKAKRVASVILDPRSGLPVDPKSRIAVWAAKFYTSPEPESSEEADTATATVDSDTADTTTDTAAPVQRQDLFKPTAPMQVLKRNNDEPTHNAFNTAPPQDLAMDDDDMDDNVVVVTNEERYVDLETLKADVSDKFRGRFGFYLHRNLMADLQELDCLQDMAKIVQAEVARIGRTYLDAIFLVAYDLLVLRGVDKQMAAAIIARVSVRYHLL
jgi:hypothetical protein